MTSYKKLNDTQLSENKWLMQDLLRKEWGFAGLIMSDWYGTYSASESLNAGLDLEIPGTGHWHNLGMISHLIGAHKIDLKTIDMHVAEVLNWVQHVARASPETVYGDHSERTRTECQEEDAEIVRRLATGVSCC